MDLNISSKIRHLSTISISSGCSLFTMDLSPWEFCAENAKLWYSIASCGKENPSETMGCSCIPRFSIEIHIGWGWAGSFTWGGITSSVIACHRPLSYLFAKTIIASKSWFILFFIESVSSLNATWLCSPKVHDPSRATSRLIQVLGNQWLAMV